MLVEPLCNIIYVQVRGIYRKVYPHVGDFFNVPVKNRSPKSLIGHQQKPSPTSVNNIDCRHSKLTKHNVPGMVLFTWVKLQQTWTSLDYLYQVISDDFEPTFRWISWAEVIRWFPMDHFHLLIPSASIFIFSYFFQSSIFLSSSVQKWSPPVFDHTCRSRAQWYIIHPIVFLLFE